MQSCFDCFLFLPAEPVFGFSRRQTTNNKQTNNNKQTTKRHKNAQFAAHSRNFPFAFDFPNVFIFAFDFHNVLGFWHTRARLRRYLAQPHTHVLKAPYAVVLTSDFCSGGFEPSGIYVCVPNYLWATADSANLLSLANGKRRTAIIARRS